MMRLTTVAEMLDEKIGRVYWRVGVSRSGIIDVACDVMSPEPALIAELAAIQYLLYEQKVFDRAPTGGAGYELIVSKGAIRKLALGKSNKTFAKRFSSFLLNRMQGVAIRVSQSKEYMADPESAELTGLVASSVLQEVQSDVIETPCMGKLTVKKHAVDQYQERLSSGDPKKPWASLVKQLQNPELVKIPIDPKVLAHKARKYGRSDNVEAWSHPTSVLVYLVVINDDGNRALVTVFERDKQYM